MKFLVNGDFVNFGVKDILPITTNLVGNLWNSTGRAVSYVRHLMDKSPYATQLVTSNAELPPDIVEKIMHNLSAGSTIQFRKVCRASHEVAKDDSVEQSIKTADSIFKKLFKEIKQRRENQHCPIEVKPKHILFLMQNHYISLDQAFEYSYHNSDSRLYDDRDLRKDIGFEYLKVNQPLKAQTCVEPFHGWRENDVLKKLPDAIFHYYLEAQDFDQCMQIYPNTSRFRWEKKKPGWVDHFDQRQVQYFLSMIQKAYENGRFDVILRILSLLHPDDETVWAGCIIALKNQLLEKGDIDNAHQLDQFKNAFQIDSRRGKLFYYIFTHQWSKAESLATLMEGNTDEQKMDKFFLLRRIKNGYRNEELTENVKLIQTLMDPIQSYFNQEKDTILYDD